jgi:hypothetical protein
MQLIANACRPFSDEVAFSGLHLTPKASTPFAAKERRREIGAAQDDAGDE